MVNKNMFVVFSVLAILVFSFGFVSAKLIFSVSELTGTVEHGNSLSIPFSATSNDPNTTRMLNLTSTSNSFTNLTSGSNVILSSAQSMSVFASVFVENQSTPLTYSVSVPSGQPAGTYTGNLTIKGTYVGTSTNVLPIRIIVTSPPEKSFCPAEVGNLKIDDLNIDNLGEGSDDEWEPLDKIEIEVDIENTHDIDDIRDVLVEIMIEDNEGNDVTNDFDVDDEEIDLGRIRDGETETAKFLIEEVPADLDEGLYKLYFKAYSERDEENQCVSKSRVFNKDKYHEIEFVREDDQAVVVREADLRESILASCGEKNVQVSFPVYNLGSDKEKRALINVYQRDLGIDKYEVVSNLRSGKKKEVNFFIDIPRSLSEDSYNLQIFTHFDYDEDEDELDENSYDLNSNDDLDKVFRKKIEIISCEEASPSISAKLMSSAKAGESMTMKVSIRNNGDDDASFTIFARDFESWADLESIEPKSLEIRKGESSDVVVTLVPKERGFNSFGLIITSSSGKEYAQPVSVNVAGRGAEDGGGAFANLFKDKLLTYIIIGIGILLILIILVMIGKVSSGRKRKNPELQ